jgi:enoyl-[acyl-carrier protein] reductase II
VDELKALLGRGRAKKGMFEGDLVEGELEIGQVSGQFGDILPAARIVEDIMAEYHAVRSGVASLPTYA